MSNHKTEKGTILPILNLRGKDYLEVKYRIVWFREEHPDWSIHTEFVSATDKRACAKATITLPNGQIMATAHKVEDAAGFADFMEKAETGAIGRALALIGYGTQFCADELDEGDRIVDAPVHKPNKMAAGYEQPGPEDGNPQAVHGYSIPFGKYAKRTLEELPVKDLGNYIDWLESNSQKTGKPLGNMQKDFIQRASAYIASLENTYSP